MCQPSLVYLFDLSLHSRIHTHCHHLLTCREIKSAANASCILLLDGLIETVMCIHPTVSIEIYIIIAEVRFEIGDLNTR